MASRTVVNPIDPMIRVRSRPSSGAPVSGLDDHQKVAAAPRHGHVQHGLSPVWGLRQQLSEASVMLSSGLSSSTV